jgi:hypothetical protein
VARHDERRVIKMLKDLAWKMRTSCWMTLEADDVDVSGNLCGFCAGGIRHVVRLDHQAKSIQGSCGGISRWDGKGLRLPGAVRCAEKRMAREQQRIICRPGKAPPPPGVFHICFSTLIYLLYTYPVMSEGLLCAK